MQQIVESELNSSDKYWMLITRIGSAKLVEEVTDYYTQRRTEQDFPYAEREELLKQLEEENES